MSGKTGRWTAVIGVALVVGAPVAVSGCGLGVLSHALPDAGQPSVDLVVTACDVTQVLPQECGAICTQAQEILQRDCGSCHTPDNATSPLPVRIADYHALVNVKSSSGQLYVDPGHTEDSLLFDMIDRGTMPPAYVFPRPSTDDIGVLQEWIRNCVPADYHPNYRDAASPQPPDPGSTPPPDAGSDAAVGGLPPSFDASGPGFADGNTARVFCPTDPPTGACSIDGFACPYSTQSCTCTNGSWACQPCPATQPTTGATCPAEANGHTPQAFRCGYGNVTCSCVPNPSDGTAPPIWACGLCPASEPPLGQGCGNTPLACAYAAQQCNCINGGWSCSGMDCPVLASYEDSSNVPCSGFYACNYSTIHESCTCQSPNGTGHDAYLKCACPAAGPANGDFCVLPAGDTCSYGNEACYCFQGRWNCADACPVAAPADGSGCSSTINCSYGGTLCYCDVNGLWHCS